MIDSLSGNRCPATDGRAGYWTDLCDSGRGRRRPPLRNEIAGYLGQPPWNAEAVEAEAALGAAGMR